MNELDKERKRKVANYLQGEYIKFQAKSIGRQEGLPSATKFAKYLGISQTMYSYFVNEQRMPTIEQADTIAEKLGPEIWKLA